MHNICSDEVLQGCSRKYFQFSVFHNITDINDPPSKEFAVFGRSILENVSKTSLPHIHFLLQYILWVIGSFFPAFDEIELYDKEMLRSPQVFETWRIKGLSYCRASNPGIVNC